MNPRLLAYLQAMSYRGGPIVETPRTSRVPWQTNAGLRELGPATPGFRANPLLQSLPPSQNQEVPRLLRNNNQDQDLAMLPVFQRIGGGDPNAPNWGPTDYAHGWGPRGFVRDPNVRDSSLGDTGWGGGAEGQGRGGAGFEAIFEAMLARRMAGMPGFNAVGGGGTQRARLRPVMPR